MLLWETQNINKLQNKIKGNRKWGDRSFVKEKGPRRWREKKGEGDEKRIQRSYIHFLIPHEECDHYIMKTCANKIK